MQYTGNHKPLTDVLIRFLMLWVKGLELEQKQVEGLVDRVTTGLHLPSEFFESVLVSKERWHIPANKILEYVSGLFGGCLLSNSKFRTSLRHFSRSRLLK